MTTVRYDVATGPSGGPTPGAIAIRDHWRIATGLSDLGIYNPRRIRGARGWSIHAEGRAVDLAANAHDPDQRDVADRYCQFLIDNAERLQIQYLIWNRRSWKPGRGWRTYTGTSLHTDHIHAEQNRDGARNVTLAQLVALWSDWTDDHSPAPTEDHDMLAAACAAIEAAYEEAGWPPSKARGQAIAKWIDEARRKAADGGDPWDAVRTLRDQLGLSVEPTWPG